MVADVYLYWNRFSSSFFSETPALRLKGHFKCVQQLGNHIMNSNKFMPIKKRLLFVKFQSLRRINHWILLNSFKRLLFCRFFNVLSIKNGKILGFYLIFVRKVYLAQLLQLKPAEILQLVQLSTNLRDILWLSYF